MKKDNLKKIAIKVSKVFLALGLVVVYGFAADYQSSRVCNEVYIDIEHTNGNKFVDEQYILGMLENLHTGGFIGQSVSEMSPSKMENLISQVDYIDEAEVYLDRKGDVRVKVKEKSPLVRVINKDGVSFYIDDQGNYMPFSNTFTSRVLVANGEISGQDFEHVDEASSVVKGIYEVARRVKENDYLKSIVVQMYVNKEGQYELVTLLGSHVVVLGDESRLEEKFNHLLTFYKASTSVVDLEKYKIVDLQYKDQIVCTKF